MNVPQRETLPIHDPVVGNPTFHNHSATPRLLSLARERYATSWGIQGQLPLLVASWASRILVSSCFS